MLTCEDHVYMPAFWGKINRSLWGQIPMGTLSSPTFHTNIVGNHQLFSRKYTIWQNQVFGIHLPTKKGYQGP